MANVVVELRIMPSDISVNLGDLEKKIKEKIKVDKISREPIAFGLVALNVTTILEDKSGEIEKMEKDLSSIEGVGQVEVVNISRVYI